MPPLLERVDLDRISDEAREVRIGRALLTVFAAVLWLVGFVAAKVVIGVWLTLAWTFTAVRLGWQDAWASSSPRRVRRVGPA